MRFEVRAGTGRVRQDEDESILGWGRGSPGRHAGELDVVGVQKGRSSTARIEV
jgi:hypothetical protein